ncbi:MAG: peroxiredoxin [Pelagibacteraceae bacterium]|nr:peroxiredoxin [Pelagibacteraceae bacterium]
MKLKVNDLIPEANIYIIKDGEPKEQSIKETLGNSKILLFGLPGAYTSTCSKLHLPGYVKYAEKLKSKGIDKIFCISVNDPHVMNAWGEVNNVGNNIKMLADPYLSFTKLIGAEIDRNSKGMGIRSSRYAMIVENLKVQNIQEEEETKSCGISSAEGILDII